MRRLTAARSGTAAWNDSPSQLERSLRPAYPTSDSVGGSRQSPPVPPIVPSISGSTQSSVRLRRSHPDRNQSVFHPALEDLHPIVVLITSAPGRAHAFAQSRIGQEGGKALGRRGRIPDRNEKSGFPFNDNFWDGPPNRGDYRQPTAEMCSWRARRRAWSNASSH